MKRILYLLGIAMFLYTGLHAQEPVFKRSGDRKLSNFNALKKPGDVSIVQTSVFFQNMTKRKIYVTERNALGAILGSSAGSKSGGNAASAELVAYLVFSDGEPTDAEYQKITNDFYDYLNKKLTQGGIKAVPWDKFTSSKYYDQVKDEKDDAGTVEEFKKKGNAWKVYTANQGPRIIRYNPINHNYNAMAVRGTVRMANYGKSVKAGTVLALNLVVDFADILLEGDVNWKESTVKYMVSPHLRITSRHNGGNQIFVFPVKSKAFDEVYNAEDIRASQEMPALVAQDPSRVQKSIFLSGISIGMKHDIDPFVVEVSKSEYFEHVKNALEIYADELVKAMVSVKK